MDAYAPPDDRRNRELLPEFEAYLDTDGQQVRPRPELLTLVQDDIRTVSMAPVDMVFSTSVYEHLEDIQGVTRALARQTSPDGIHVHYIDLRDHFFKYPFEMLCYSERAWRSWLNPTSNLNRCRLSDYQRVFGECFADVDVEILESDGAALRAVLPRLQPQFLTGDEEVDGATLICIVTHQPLVYQNIESNETPSSS